jgi:hypothetical protein
MESAMRRTSRKPRHKAEPRIAIGIRITLSLETLRRRALCRDARGNASPPLGAALDLLAVDDGSTS